MAGLSPKQVAGRHLPMFEIYYLSLDPTGKGQVSALDAAKFLKRSGLSDAILSKIWDLSDPTGKGYLDKVGIFVGLKLVAFAQNGRDVSLASILDDSVPEPELSSDRAPPPHPQPISNKVEPMRPPHPPAPIVTSIWTIKDDELGKYRQLFNGLGPEAGKIPGGKAKSLLMDSKLPFEILGKIWDLADADKDGSLSEGEFAVAMHCVYKCLENHPLPECLPPELQRVLAAGPIPRVSPVVPPPVSAVPPPVQLVPVISAPQSQPSTIIMGVSPAPLIPIATDNWIVPHDERGKFKSLFHSTDLDHDGYVSGAEIKGLFLQSGLQQHTLAHIWNLCDTDQSGKLSADQFTLAMWLVSNALKGIQPPTALTPEMYPPGMTVPQVPQEPELSPEFELIMKEINELTQEKLNLELDIAVKESDKKIKSGESKSLQSELDTLAATLKQLENQRTIAHGKLSELDGQVSALRFQAEEQEATLVVQELEVSSKAAELKGLDQEEKDLLSGLETCGRDIERLGQVLQETLLQISQAKTRVSSLTELEETMKNSIIKYTSAIESNNAYTVTEPELRDVKSELDELIGLPSPSPKFNGNVSVTSDTNGFPTSFDSSFTGPSGGDPAHTNSWDHDPFAPAKPADPFAPRDPFAPHDPFAPAATLPAPSSMPQDASPGFGTDPFGAEPFEAEPPALPPKKAPPRPAPPKNAPARPPPPSKPAPPVAKADPFSQGDNFEAGFADFSSFNSQPWGSSTTTTTTQNSSNNNFSSVSNTNNNNSNTSRARRTRAQQDHTALEFTEDPFKNYRYEDPFANADPFAGL